MELVVSNETVPPGGMLQLNVFLTEPQPIRKGSPMLAFASTLLGKAQGLSMYSPGGDAIGAAVVSSGNVKMIAMSSLSDYGMDIDAPVVSVSIPVSSTALPGETVDLTLDPNTVWLDPNGNPYPTLVKEGLLTVGGTLSIFNVVPGTGVAPAGSTVKVRGMGFQPDSKVNINNAIVVSTQFVSSSEVDVVLAADTRMDGQRVRLTNKSSGETTTYYCYLRTKPLGSSSVSLLAKTVPLFSQVLYTKGYFRTVAGSTFLGVAAQNANPQSANVTIKLFSPTNTFLGSTTISLPPATRYSRSVWELFPSITPADNLIVKMVSDLPVGMLGLLGDLNAKTVAPVAPSSTP